MLQPKHSLKYCYCSCLTASEAETLNCTDTLLEMEWKIHEKSPLLLLLPGLKSYADQQLLVVSWYFCFCLGWELNQALD